MADGCFAPSVPANLSGRFMSCSYAVGLGANFTMAKSKKKGWTITAQSPIDCRINVAHMSDVHDVNSMDWGEGGVVETRQNRLAC